MKYDQTKNNPCLKEQKLTYTCLAQNDYDREKCELTMQNYNACKTFWGRVRAERKRKGIQPYLPEPEEREKIKSDYIKMNR
ncbi:hypothetical protein RN001_001984 [Aquatica leii]|uniref:Coiled-coil-helix-coiled-coil-helix domain-containing protein 7 n=1 Tax=Aquatica leii TaxID=1421715 RepID=A0AAN7PGR8_9COLE|nr:hypothetical protein RN001_001984 [Aquatica leii]